MKTAQPSVGAAGAVPTPSPAAAELAALLHEIRSMDPDRLQQIAQATEAFHAARRGAEAAATAAEAAKREADDAQAKLALRRAEHEDRVKHDVAVLADREDRAALREAEVGRREDAVQEREDAVQDREQAIALVREQLGG